jgi:hypothetical protein
METLREEVAALKKKIPKGGRHNELAVNFQEVVHSVLTGNADVAKPQ